MALSTTQSIWRSGGGDQTRTAYCGTALMAAQFYIADVSAAASTNVQLSDTNTNPVILPAGAVITNVIFTVDDATGQTDMGFTTYTTGTNTAAGILDNASNTLANYTVGSTGAGTSMGVVMDANEMVYITARVGGSAGTGDMTGTILYYVTDPLIGQQNV
jgi:hypothetical protein